MIETYPVLSGNKPLHRRRGEGSPLAVPCKIGLCRAMVETMVECYLERSSWALSQYTSYEACFRRNKFTVPKPQNMGFRFLFMRWTRGELRMLVKLLFKDFECTSETLQGRGHTSWAGNFSCTVRLAPWGKHKQRLGELNRTPPQCARCAEGL